MNPPIEPTIDVLQLISRFRRNDDGIRAQELQALAYLACILSVFDGWPVARWGYGFIATGAGAPYSGELQESLDRLMAAGMVEDHADSFSLSTSGLERHAQLSELRSAKERARFLDAATDTTLALAVPTATSAVLLEPQLRNSILLSQRRRLLDQAGLVVLRPYLDGLRDISPNDQESLFAAAVLWLKYLMAERAGSVTGV